MIDFKSIYKKENKHETFDVEDYISWLEDRLEKNNPIDFGMFLTGYSVETVCELHEQYETMKKFRRPKGFL